jgi:hypothetical protein
MIARYQTVLFAVLLAASVAMGGILWHLRERAHQRLIVGEDSAPTKAPEVAPAEQATLIVANDADNSLLSEAQTLPLPQDAESRARVIVGKLLDLYAAPDATHPVPGGATSVAQIFLLPLPSQSASSREIHSPGTHPSESKPSPNGPELAVVNLTPSFAANHPSGIESETLTVLSICGTLHANLPRVTEVRFLVDGQPHATLAGHADLTRTYLATDAVPTAGVHP